MKNRLKFPKGFSFGTSTSSYQIEGAWDEDGKGKSVWDKFSHTKGKIKSGHTGDIACDHYHRFREDIKLMKKIGVNAYRFSVSWPRIMPDGRGAINEKGLDFYSRLVDELLRAGITPFITLFHWDLPLKLQDDIGGFKSRDCAEYFSQYAQIVVRRLGDRVGNWITLNEPAVYAFAGHLTGYHAPGVKNIWSAMKCIHNLLLGHAYAVNAIKSISKRHNVGISLNLSPIYPMTCSERDKHASDMADQFINRLFLDPLFKGEYPPEFWRKAVLVRPKIKNGDMRLINTPIDFLGINNYTRNIVYYCWKMPFFHFWIAGLDSPDEEFIEDGIQHTAMGWEVYPDGIYELLMRIKEEYGNIKTYITENGAAFNDAVENGKINDIKRINFLVSYIQKVHQALKKGANIKGYFIWSLMDNFEWAEGYTKRFGIIYTDYDSQKRIMKESSKWYTRLIRGRIYTHN